MALLLRRLRLFTRIEGTNPLITLLFDMNILWTSSSAKSNIAEIELSQNFASIDLMNWLKEIYPLITDKMKSRGLKWMDENEWDWFLGLIENALARRTGVVFVARKRILFVDDRLVMKLSARDRLRKKSTTHRHK